jgi:hypothetical protein
MKNYYSNILFILMVLLIVTSISATYYKYIILRDYETYEYIEEESVFEDEVSENLN